MSEYSGSELVQAPVKQDRPSSNVGDDISVTGARWNFGGDVASKFDNHVTRSVPLYESGHDLTVQLSDYFVKRNSVVYEIGSSTGTLIKKLSVRHADLSGSRFIGLESEDGMVDHSRQRHSEQRNLSFQKTQVQEFEFDKADLITSHYTIQFIQPKHRQGLFDKIYRALEWGGGFIMFEKVRASDAWFQDMITTLYGDFKAGNGFRPEEILSKTSSLKGVMEPFSSEANLDLMRRAGFKDVVTIQKYLCFEGWLAIK